MTPEATTTERGGNGKSMHELGKIIDHHKGGGLGTNANSVKSVLISASTTPQQNFGPPYYILKVAPERLRVHAPDIGGGFGMKIMQHEEYALCALAAKDLGAPVKWIS